LEHKVYVSLSNLEIQNESGEVTMSHILLGYYL
jgi:hypothetical protein